MNYCTEAEANTYLTARLNVEAWEDASSADRVKALNMSTDAIDRLSYLGKKTDEDQVNQFPRGTDVAVPQDIQDACAELALRFLDGIDPELEYENLQQVQQGYANVKSTYDRSRAPEHVAAGITSIVAWRKIRPYLRDPASLEIHRV